MYLAFRLNVNFVTPRINVVLYIHIQIFMIFYVRILFEISNTLTFSENFWDLTFIKKTVLPFLWFCQRIFSMSPKNYIIPSILWLKPNKNNFQILWRVLWGKLSWGTKSKCQSMFIHRNIWFLGIIGIRE